MRICKGGVTEQPSACVCNTMHLLANKFTKLGFADARASKAYRISCSNFQTLTCQLHCPQARCQLFEIIQVKTNRLDSALIPFVVSTLCNFTKGSQLSKACYTLLDRLLVLLMSPKAYATGIFTTVRTCYSCFCSWR